MALIDQPHVSVTAPITPDEIKIGGVPTESGALKLCVQDYLRTEEWLRSKQWALRWAFSQLMYEPLITNNTWEGTDVPRANVNFYTVAKHVQSILPQIMNGLFADDPPFSLTPRPSVTEDTARAVSALLHFQLEDCGFREEIRIGVRDCLTFGTGIWKWSWQSFTRKDEIYHRSKDPITIKSDVPGLPDTTLHTTESDTIEVEEITENIDKPILENCDLREVFVDPSLRYPDIRKANFVIHRMKLNAEELEDLRNYEGYEIPPKEELHDLLFPPEEKAPVGLLEAQRIAPNFTHQAASRDQKNTVDPTFDDSKFELLERWDKNKVITVLNRKLVIRNERNPFGRLPFESVTWYDVPNSFYGLGIGVTHAFEQLIQKGLTEAHLDEVFFNLNLPILIQQGKNVPVQNIRMALGKFLKVEDVNAIKPMDRIQAVPEAFAEVQMSEARAESVSGANELITQGNMPAQGRTSITRTATGSNLLAAGSGARLEAFVERIGDQVFEPTLDAFHEMNRRLLPLERLRYILNDELAQAYEGDHLDILNAKVTFDILAAARMAAKRNMAQSLPMLTQMLVTDPMHTMLQAQGKKLNVVELVKMWFDVSGWKNYANVILDMTPEDEQRAAMQNPAVQQIGVQKQKQAGETDSKLQVVDAENSARAYRELQRQVIEKAGESEAVNGSPGDQGFGSNQ
jgi:hypothetical protein